jgi:hypothetical protein
MTIRELLSRLDVYPDPASWWMGAYLAPNAVYVCPVPCLVIRWAR